MRRVLANTSASSRGDTRRASVICNEKASKGWKAKRSWKEDSGKVDGEMKCIEMDRKIEGESSYLRRRELKRRRHGSRERLETSVVQAENDEWKVEHSA